MYKQNNVTKTKALIYFLRLIIIIIYLFKIIDLKILLLYTNKKKVIDLSINCLIDSFE